MPERPFRSSFPDFEASNFRTRSWSKGLPRTEAELEPLYATLLHALGAAARAERGGITVLGEREADPSETRSYRVLYSNAFAVAEQLVANGVKRGDRVLLVLPTSHEFVTLFFAVLAAGAVPVPTYPPALPGVELAIERLCHVARATTAAWCVSNRALRPLLGALVFAVGGLSRVLTVEELAATRPSSKPRTDATAADVALIQCTSGSTGHPKGVVLTHGNLLSNIHAVGQACRINRNDVGVSWMPLYHDMGLIGSLLFCIYWRIPLVLLSQMAFLEQPVRWLRAIQQHRGTLSPAPNFAYQLCARRVKPQEREGLDLSSWRLALNGGEPVNLRTLVEFERAFVPHGYHPTAMLPVYGLAEASLAVAFPDSGTPLVHESVDRQELARGRAMANHGKGAQALVSVGTALPGHQLLVVDDKGKPLPPREVGHIVVRGPSVMRGYFGDDEATRAVLRSGWLWTGDLGFFSSGQLFITGRAKDLLIVRGHNYYAEDLEHVAERVGDLRAGGAVAFGVYDEEKATDLAVLVCETRLATQPEQLALVKELTASVAQHCGVTLDEVVLAAPGTIPKTASGKRQRSLCRDLYLRGALEPHRTSRLRLSLVFMRSRAGFIVGGIRRMWRRRPAD